MHTHAHHTPPICMHVDPGNRYTFIPKELCFHFTKHLTVLVFFRISFLVMAWESLETLYISLITRLKNA